MDWTTARERVDWVMVDRYGSGWRQLSPEHRYGARCREVAALMMDSGDERFARSIAFLDPNDDGLKQQIVDTLRARWGDDAWALISRDMRECEIWRVTIDLFLSMPTAAGLQSGQQFVRKIMEGYDAG